MKDLYLKTDTEAAMRAALLKAGMSIDHDSGRLLHEQTEIATIGTIILPSNDVTKIDDEGFPIYTAIPGYHVNMRTADEQLAAALAYLDCKPDHPVVVFGS
ncbi:hypothetical protein OB952_08070 [Aeromonas salmonicida]|uniref:hypothetical protein n=1 Tax=Aeromonas salmonicida TaxID=645 RepID=UPI00259F1704|nr:hypothetical protein [Aeromonas salmonicida]MDM5067321.1 hypothetical protein [Aeromonas salmonicida]